MVRRTAAMDEWVSRVLGYRFAPSAGSVAARFEAARSQDAPKAALTGSLLAAMSRVTPEAQDLPAILSGMVPRFLLAIQNEPNMDARLLVPGATVSAQDQVLGVADSHNAVLRSARRWEALLAQAEKADATIGGMQNAERDAERQAAYEELVASYNAIRTAALEEEARCMELVASLAAEFRAAQAAAAGQDGRP